MVNRAERKDRRIQRTRQALQQAFKEAAQEKGFAATTVQDITDRANVNRGTFYLHFTDKYALMDATIREDLQHLWSRSLPTNASWNKSTLRLLIRTLLDYFEKKYQHQQYLSPAIAPLVEKTVHSELTGLIATWLEQREKDSKTWRVPSIIIARFVSWGIFGSAIQWSQEESTISLEQTTDTILLVVLEGVEGLVPDILST